MSKYISFEQEAVLNDVNLVPLARLDMGYIVVSDYPWGGEPLDWKPTLIGPFSFTEESNRMRQAISEHSGCVCAGSERGKWNGGLYTPHPSEV